MNVRPRIGERNQRITIEYRSAETSDGQGGRTPTWATRATVWAKEEQLSASESLTASQLVGQRMTAWTISYRSDLSAKDRITVGSRTLQVVSYGDVDGHRAYTRVVCTEELA